MQLSEKTTSFFQFEFAERRKQIEGVLIQKDFEDWLFLLEICLFDEHWLIRKSAAEAFLHAPYPREEVTDILTEYLQTSNEQASNKRFLMILGHTGCLPLDRTLPRLEGFFSRSNQENKIFFLQTLLFFFGQEWGKSDAFLGFLAEVLHQGLESEERQVMVTSFTALSKLPKGLFPDIDKKLLSVVMEEGEEVLSLGLDCLHHASEVSIFQERLFELSQFHKSNRIRVSASEKLTNMFPAEGILLRLEEIFATGNVKAKERVMFSLGSLYPEEDRAESLLLLGVRDKSNKVRKSAIAAVGKAKRRTPEIIEDLFLRLGEAESSVVTRAEDSLKKLLDEGSFEYGLFEFLCRRLKLGSKVFFENEEKRKEFTRLWGMFLEHSAVSQEKGFLLFPIHYIAKELRFKNPLMAGLLMDLGEGSEAHKGKRAFPKVFAGLQLVNELFTKEADGLTAMLLEAIDDVLSEVFSNMSSKQSSRLWRGAYVRQTHALLIRLKKEKGE